MSYSKKFKEEEKKNSEPFNWNQIGQYLGLVYQVGFTVVVSILVFMFLGRLIDRWLNLPGVFMIIGIVAGAIGSFYSVYKAIIKMEDV